MMKDVSRCEKNVGSFAIFKIIVQSNSQFQKFFDLILKGCICLFETTLFLVFDHVYCAISLCDCLYQTDWHSNK